MNFFRQAGMQLGLIAGGALFGAALIWALFYVPHRETPHVPPPPAKVSKVLKEAQINVITLTQDAVDRLAIRTAQVKREPVRMTRMYGGEITIPIGRAIIVSAPLGGTLRATPGGMPRPGQAVKKGDHVLDLLPLLTPEGLVNLTAAKIEADGQVAAAKTQVDATKIVLDRAQRLLEIKSGSEKAMQDAQAVYDLAQKTLTAATNRRTLLHRVVGELDKGTAAPLAIEAPEDGILRSVSALPGQTVPSGAALFEVVDLDRVWVRVPIYSGELNDVDPKEPASITRLSARAGAKGELANPVAAFPSADPVAGTVDLIYELDNSKNRYGPGHRVGVSLEQTAKADSLTLPWEAVIHDVYGGTWVYERTSEREFVRRRVTVRFVKDGTAVLGMGPPEGTDIVTAGPAELFGAETGFSK